MQFKLVRYKLYFRIIQCLHDGYHIGKEFVINYDLLQPDYGAVFISMAAGKPYIQS